MVSVSHSGITLLPIFLLKMCDEIAPVYAVWGLGA